MLQIAQNILDAAVREGRAEILGYDPNAYFTGAAECRGLVEDHVYADYEAGGVRLSVSGPVTTVVRILRAAR